MFMLFSFLLRKWREFRAGAAAGVEALPGDGAIDFSTAAAGRSDAPRVVDPELPRPSAAARGPAVLLLHQVRFDLLTSLRNPRARFFTFFFPIVLLVVFTGVFGHGHTVVDGVRVSLSRFYVPGILAMSIVVASYANLVISITSLRETGVLKRRRATPVSPVLLVAGQALATVVVALVMGTLLLVIAKIFYGVGMSPAGLAAMAITAAVATLAFACIGYAVSILVGSPDAAQPIVQATMLPLWFISGVFIPTATLSATLRSVGSLFPVEHIAAGLHLASVHTTFSGAISGKDLLALAAWGVAAAIFCAWRFSWLPSTATA
ncbi:MAG TPA: ABC transporter permease [Solirubrobacteraceae bacterium]|nr:ABC transporter permease [Solirubrobacteraceae bacterium]